MKKEELTEEKSEKKKFDFSQMAVLEALKEDGDFCNSVCNVCYRNCNVCYRSCNSCNSRVYYGI